MDMNDCFNQGKWDCVCVCVFLYFWITKNIKFYKVWEQRPCLELIPFPYISTNDPFTSSDSVFTWQTGANKTYHKQQLSRSLSTFQTAFFFMKMSRLLKSWNPLNQLWSLLISYLGCPHSLMLLAFQHHLAFASQQLQEKIWDLFSVQSMSPVPDTFIQPIWGTTKSLRTNSPHKHYDRFKARFVIWHIFVYFLQLEFIQTGLALNIMKLFLYVLLSCIT